MWLQFTLDRPTEEATLHSFAAPLSEDLAA
jgi:hypothetical protein